MTNTGNQDQSCSLQRAARNIFLIGREMGEDISGLTIKILIRGVSYPTNDPSSLERISKFLIFRKLHNIRSL